MTQLLLLFLFIQFLLRKTALLNHKRLQQTTHIHGEQLGKIQRRVNVADLRPTILRKVGVQGWISEHFLHPLLKIACCA